MPAPRLMLEILKEALKKRRIRYPEIARACGVSLPTVKRWMNDEEISLSRLTSIAELAGLELWDLAEQARARKPSIHCFTREQEEFLAANFGYLAFYYELRSGRSPEEVATKHGLSSKSRHKYLRGLERLGLIGVGMDGRVRLRVRQALGWEQEGPLGRIYSERMLAGLFDQAKKAGEGEETWVQLRGRNLTEKQIADLRSDLQALDEKYRRLSEYNRGVIAPGELRALSWLMVISNWECELMTRIPELFSESSRRAAAPGMKANSSPFHSSFI